MRLWTSGVLRKKELGKVKDHSTCGRPGMQDRIKHGVLGAAQYHCKHGSLASLGAMRYKTHKEHVYKTKDPRTDFENTEEM